MHTVYGVAAGGTVGDIAVRAWRGVLQGFGCGLARERRRTYEDILDWGSGEEKRGGAVEDGGGRGSGESANALGMGLEELEGGHLEGGVVEEREGSCEREGEAVIIWDGHGHVVCIAGMALAVGARERQSAGRRVNSIPQYHYPVT